MLFEHSNEQSLIHEAWKPRNDLIAESEDRDAARGVEEFLGFSDAEFSDATVFIRTKILYQPEAKTQICNVDDFRNQLSICDNQGRRISEIG